MLPDYEDRPIQVRINELSRKIVDQSRHTTEGYDPLKANQFFHDLPKLRNTGDIDAIRYQAITIANEARTIDLSALSFSHLRAVHRDTAMAVNAATLSANAGQDIPNAEAVVPGSTVLLGQLADATGFSPRLTDQLYLLPLNSRRFTDEQVLFNCKDDTGEEHEYQVFAEDIFKTSVSEGLLHQPAFIEAAVGASASDIASNEFVQYMHAATDQISAMVAGMTAVGKYTKDPWFRDWFNTKLYPMFLTYYIGDTLYIHSGSQMTHMLIADEMAWKVDEDDGFYEETYRQKNLPYATADHKAAFQTVQQNLAGKGSIVSQVTKLFADGEQEPWKLDRAAVTMEFLREIAKFRKPHEAGIKRVTASRPGGGSSGGNIDIPSYLGQKIQQQIDTLKPYYDIWRSQQ